MARKVKDPAVRFAEAYADYVNRTFSQPDTVSLPESVFAGLKSRYAGNFKSGKFMGLTVKFTKSGIKFSKSKK